MSEFNTIKCSKCSSPMQRHKADKIESYKCTNKDCDNKFTLYSLDDYQPLDKNNINFA